MDFIVTNTLSILGRDEDHHHFLQKTILRAQPALFRERSPVGSGDASRHFPSSAIRTLVTAPLSTAAIQATCSHLISANAVTAVEHDVAYSVDTHTRLLQRLFILSMQEKEANPVVLVEMDAVVFNYPLVMNI